MGAGCCLWALFVGAGSFVGCGLWGASVCMHVILLQGIIVGPGVIVGCCVVVGPGVVNGCVVFEPKNDDEQRFPILVCHPVATSLSSTWQLSERNGMGGLTSTCCRRLVGCRGFAEPMLVGRVFGEGSKQWVMCVDVLSMVVVTWKAVGRGFRQIPTCRICWHPF